MPDRPGEQAALERELADLAADLRWPPTPDLAAAIGHRLPATVPARRRVVTILGRPIRRSLLLAAAALLLGVGATVAAGLGIGGLRIVLVPELIAPAASGALSTGGPGSSATPGATAVPTAPPASPGASGGPLGAGLGLGEPVSVADLRARSSIPVAVPRDPALGEPTAWLARGVAGPVATLVYPAGPAAPEIQRGIGLLVMEFGGRVDEAFATKLVEQGTTIERVEVDGRPGLWIEGPHAFFFDLPGGGSGRQDPRLAGDTLVWEEGRTLYRIESGLGREATIALAGTMR